MNEPTQDVYGGGNGASGETNVGSPVDEKCRTNANYSENASPLQEMTATTRAPSAALRIAKT